MTRRPELGSVAPPARMPPKFWTATQMSGKHHDGQDHRHLGDLRWSEHPSGHDEADDGQQDGHGRPVMEEEGFRGPVDMGEPSRLSTVHPATRS